MVQELLNQEFCLETNQDRACASDANKDCFVRLYLGKRRPRPGRKSRWFQLRNFALHLDQMEALGLDVEYYAMAMADVLAIRHFVAKLDADDIELMLGGPLAAALCHRGGEG